MTARTKISAAGGALLDIPLDRGANVSLSEQLYRGIKDLILMGALGSGARLPATRTLAKDLALSRNTVLSAYDQLTAEGYLSAHQGAGTRVSPDIPILDHGDDAAAPKPGGKAGPPLPDLMLDLPSRRQPALARDIPFMPGLPDVRQFPFDEWGRVVGRFWRHPDMDALNSRDIRGYAPLRKTIADYLVSVRGLRCSADQVIITSGAQQGLDLCARLLLSPGETVVMENPGYRGFLSAFSAAGADVRPVAVDDEGLSLKGAMAAAGTPRLVAVTPSHQFPVGVTMSLARRLALLDWARERNFWILEDDYDSEFRYGGRPLAALQGLDEGERVIYAGTFSKVMFPALRLGYLVVPDGLIDPMLRLRSVVDEFPALGMQPILADFMESGRFGAHVRRMRQIYNERQLVLRAQLADRLGGQFAVPEDNAGMHLTVQMDDQMRDGDISREALDEGITARALSGYCHGGNRRNGLVLGYAAYEPAELVAASEKLERAITRLGGGK